MEYSDENVSSLMMAEIRKRKDMLYFGIPTLTDEHELHPLTSKDK